MSVRRRPRRDRIASRDGAKYLKKAPYLAAAKLAAMWITPETLEAPPGFEPGNKGFAGLCLTAWLRRLKKEGLHVLSDGLTPLPKRETGLEPATPTLARWCSTN